MFSKSIRRNLVRKSKRAMSVHVRDVMQGARSSTIVATAKAKEMRGYVSGVVSLQIWHGDKILTLKRREHVEGLQDGDEAEEAVVEQEVLERHERREEHDASWANVYTCRI